MTASELHYSPFPAEMNIRSKGLARSVFMIYYLLAAHGAPTMSSGRPLLSVYEIEPAIWGRVGPDLQLQPRSTQPEGTGPLDTKP